jgi:hypothetical protein
LSKYCKSIARVFDLENQNFAGMGIQEAGLKVIEGMHINKM